MTRPAFSAPVAAALDSYSVPPLPAGFADRLVARAANDAAVTSPDQSAMPRQRPHSRHSRSPWARAGRLIGSVSAITFVTAAAAAAGFFGEPVYVPGVTEILVETKFIAPAKASNPKIIATPAAKSNAGIGTTDEALSAMADASPSASMSPGRNATQAMLRSLAANIEFGDLPVVKKRAAARKEARQHVRSGKATPAGIRSALRQRRGAGIARGNIPPEIRGKRRAQIAKHIAAKRAATKADVAQTSAAKAPASNVQPSDIRAAVKSATGNTKPALVKAQVKTDNAKIYTVIEPRAAVLAPPARAKTKAAIDRARLLPAPPASVLRRDRIRDGVRKRHDARLPAPRPNASRPPHGSAKPRPAPRPKPHRPRKPG